MPAVVPLHEAHEVQHLLGDGATPVRPLAAEEVEGRAAGGGGADRRVAQGDDQLGGVVGAVLALGAPVAPVAGVQIPKEGPAAQVELPLKPSAEEPGFDVLLEQSGAGLQGPPPHEGEVAVGHGQVRAEGVVRLVRADDHIVQKAVAAAVAQAQRLRGALGGGAALGVGGLADEAQPIGHLMGDLGVEVQPSVGRLQEVVAVAVVVEAVRAGEGVKVPAGGVLRVEGRQIGAAVVQHAVVQGQVRIAQVGAEHEAPLRGEGGAAAVVATSAEGVGKGGLGALGGEDRLLLRELGAEQELGGPIPQYAAPEGGQFVGGAVPVGNDLAGLCAELQAAEALLGDQVDHAADGVGAVDGGSAVLQNLHPLDDAAGQGVEIHRARHAGGRGPGDPAPPVHQHQGALGAEVAQRQLHRPGADAGPVLGKAEVARHIEAGVDGGAGDGQLLQRGA